MLSKFIIGIYIITTSAALVVMKLGTQNSNGNPNGKLDLLLNPIFVLGVFLYGVSFITYVYLISKYDLGYIIPLLAAFVYILTFLAAYFIFNEAFTVFKVAGIALILLGLVFLNLRSA